MDAKNPKNRRHTKRQGAKKAEHDDQPKASELKKGPIGENRRAMPTLGAIPTNAPNAPYGDIEEETLDADAPYNHSYGIKK